MKTACPQCGLETITLEPHSYQDVRCRMREGIAVYQDCFCFLNEQDCDELEARYDPEEHARSFTESRRAVLALPAKTETE